MKHVEILILEPARKKGEFHTVDAEGKEAKILERITLDYDEANRKWVRSPVNGEDGANPRFKANSFWNPWTAIGYQILEHHFPDKG